MGHKNRMNIARSEIVLDKSDIQKEICLWQVRVSEKEKELSELSIQIQDIKIALNLFLGEYNSRVGLLYVKLDKLKLKIEEYQTRIELAQGKKVSQEDLQLIEDEVERKFSQEQRKVDDLENEAFESSEEHRRHLEEEKGYSLDDEVQQECKTLYRKLARRFHPDMAKDEKQRKEFHKIFIAINEAYKNSDLEILRKYMSQAEREEKIAKETLEEKLIRLKQDYKLIAAVVAKLRAELEDLKASETYRLKDTVDRAKLEGKDLLQELAAKIKEEIAENQALLERLVVMYRKIIGGLAY